MKAQLLAALLQILTSLMTEDLLRKFADMVLDWIENMVIGSASTLDDKLVLPMCAQIRAAFGIEDNDEETSG